MASIGEACEEESRAGIDSFGESEGEGGIVEDSFGENNNSICF